MLLYIIPFQVLVDNSISIIGLNKIERRLQIILAIKIAHQCSFDSVECLYADLAMPTIINEYSKCNTIIIHCYGVYIVARLFLLP